MALVLVGQQARRQSMVDEDEKLIEERDEIEEREVLRRASNVTRVESAFTVYKARAAELMKEHNPDLISQAAFKDICRIQRERFLGCLSLPGTLFVFFLFALSTYLHADVLTAYLVESVVGNHIGQNSADIETIPQAWEWLEGTTGQPGLVDLFWGDGNEDGNSTKEIWKPVLTYNYLVGPIVLKQLRSGRALCTQTGYTNMLCYKGDSRSVESYIPNDLVVPAPDPNEYNSSMQVSAERRKDYWDRAFETLSKWKTSSSFSGQFQSGRRLEEEDSGSLDWFSEDSMAFKLGRNLRAFSGDMTQLPGVAQADTESFTTLLSPNNYKTTIQDQLRYLRAGNWLDEQTLSLKIQTVLLNAEVGRPRLTQVVVIMYFSRAGGVFTDVEVNTVFLKFWPGFADMSFGADFIFICCLIVMTVVQARQVPWKRYFLRVRNFRRIVSRVTAPAGMVATMTEQTGTPLFWSLLQLAIIGCGWACVACHGQAFLFTRQLAADFEETWKAQEDDLPAENTVGTSFTLHDTVDAFVNWNGTTRFLFALYHILLIVRFFIAFHAQPRLGVVTRTLEVSLIDILHFLVVLLPTFCSYAISGCFIFGKRVQDFSNLIASVGTCFKIFMESEYDWIILSEEDFWTPFVWVLTFMILLVMIMLNMVLAIILDVYTEIRKKSGQSETVWVTMFHGLQQMYHWRHWIANSELTAKVGSLPPHISRADLTRVFPGMCDEQVEQLFAAARNHHITTEQGNEQDARKLALSVKLVMDNINKVLAQLDEGNSQDSPLQAGEQGWLPDLSREMASQNHMMLSLQWHLQQIEWQWQALDAIHGPEATFSGQHKLGNKKEPEPL